MNKEIFEGTWEEIKGKMKKTWGKLTDNDFTEIKGDHQEIFGKLRKLYGYSKEEAQKEVARFKDNV